MPSDSSPSLYVRPVQFAAKTWFSEQLAQYLERGIGPRREDSATCVGESQNQNAVPLCELCSAVNIRKTVTDF